MEKKRVEHPPGKHRRGRWTVVIVAGGLIVLGLLTFGGILRGVRGGIPLSREVFSWETAFSDPDRTSPTILSLPDVVVKLKVADGPDVFVDAAFDLELASAQDREAVRQQLSRVREETIGFLSELSPAELRGSDELTKTKARLLERVQNLVPSRRLKALYLSYLAVGPGE